MLLLLDELKAKLEQNKNVTATRSIDALRAGYVLTYTGTRVYVAIRYASLARSVARRSSLFQCLRFFKYIDESRQFEVTSAWKNNDAKVMFPYSDFGKQCQLEKEVYTGCVYIRNTVGIESESLS